MTLDTTGAAVNGGETEHAHHEALANWILAWEREFPAGYLGGIGGVKALAKNPAFILVLDAKAKSIATLSKTRMLNHNAAMTNLAALQGTFGTIETKLLTQAVIDAIANANRNAREMMTEGE